MPQISLPPGLAALELNLDRLAGQLQGLPKQDILIARLLVYVGRDLSAGLDQRLRPLGLNEVEFRVLISLFAQREPVYPSDLCSQVSHSPATITRITDGLAERGLISRVPSAADRRRWVLQLTPGGDALVRSLSPTLCVMVEHTFRDFSNSEKQLLVQLLKRLAQNAAHQPIAEETET